MTPIVLISLFVAYLLGSIPFGLIIGKINGVDIRDQGSGNIGATNVFRCVGKGWGICAFLLDFAKGLAGALLIPYIASLCSNHDFSHPERLVLGFAAIIGHNWPVFLKFKGGKGIATSAGVLAGVAPLVIPPALIFWLLLLLTSRYVSLASIGACIAVSTSSWVFYYDESASNGWIVPTVLTVLGAMGVWRHRSNIKRLMNGTENRFDFSKKQRKGQENEQK